MTEEQAHDLGGVFGEQFCYLTTMGRVTGKPHDIEIWFVGQNNSIYLMAGNHKSDWVKNLRKDPDVTVRIGKQHFKGTARLVTEEQEERAARYRMAEKYQEWEDDGKTPDEWARTALVVAIDVHSTLA
jgi:deazaflavin-dependent oxidoreductase (nitroreductase family)